MYSYWSVIHNTSVPHVLYVRTYVHVCAYVLNRQIRPKRSCACGGMHVCVCPTYVRAHYTGMYIQVRVLVACGWVCLCVGVHEVGVPGVYTYVGTLALHTPQSEDL